MFKQTVAELAETLDHNSRNWRGIGIAILVIIVLSSIIAAAVFFISPELRGIGKHVKKEKLLLDEIIQGVFSTRGFNGSWISDNELMYSDHKGNLVILNVDNEKQKPNILVKSSILQTHFAQKFSLSANRKYLLIVNEIKKAIEEVETIYLLVMSPFRYFVTLITRNTNYSEFATKLILFRAVSQLTTDPKIAFDDLQYASWGPKGTQLVFVHRQNIYYKPNATATAIKIASSSDETVIYNGIPDWLYEEEILSASNAIWWSPNGTRICFASFNDSQVDLMSLTVYGRYEDPTNLYPSIEQIHYPKPGRQNPSVKLWVYTVNDYRSSSVQLIPPNTIKDTDHYFTTVQWLNDDDISVYWLNRIQNYSVVTICSLSNSWNCNFEMTSKTNGWVEPYEPPMFTEDKKYYFLRIPSFQKNKNDYFRHIAKISVKNSDGSFEMLTSGAFDTTEVLVFNPTTNTLYYISTLPSKSGERHLFSVDIRTKQVKCLSCVDEDCRFNTAKFSEKAKYFVFECLGPQIPKIELRRSEDNEFLSKKLMECFAVMNLQSNYVVKEKLANKVLPTSRTLIVPLQGGFSSDYMSDASVKLFIPPTLREDDTTKYPLLIHVYGGPGSQQVNERFTINWGFYLSSRKNIIYGMIDGRGSGYKGDKMLHSIYRKLGTFEVEDQITVTQYLSDTLEFVDKKRIAIWGWSYGGYVAALALANKNSLFSCGISVAPVTSWLYYDSAYTERYMGFPTVEDNFVNYQEADVLHKTSNLKEKKFLLIHGTADDNVHLQQSMMLIKSLTRTGVLFQQQIYPDENHALIGVTRHLYETMESFLNDCFDLDMIYDDVGLRRSRFAAKG
ncbi:Inactive dipeptidyl peptidase 10-like protein [Leptotrombidium deliense]|uniref:Venom dipeptidyl peptidase 4 n=1 Tax=Leptotrombidium deliense TaxID=299467 RepID=A0A443SRE6_9ACAR|nr:Inactive dipeptidyl peptidase 10-like protein [Leptotrombidium deliense]